MVSAAASVQDAMRELATSAKIRVVFNFGASGMLAQQIQQGAPADIFLSAAPKPMDTLAAAGLIVEDTRRDLMRNRIVLIAPPDGGPRAFSELGSAKLIAMGEPVSVPAGEYGRQVLTTMGLWDRVQTKLAFAKDVRQVLAYVENGDADAGIVYATDVSEKVRVVETAPESSHEPVVYPIAVLKQSRHPEAARAFVELLAGPEGRASFARHRFTL